MAAKNLRFLQVIGLPIVEWFAENATLLRRFAGAWLLLQVNAGLPNTATAAPERACEPLSYQEHAFVVCSFDVRKTTVRTFLRSPQGEVYGGFDRVAGDLAKSGAELTFAMNGGMYDPDYEPVGLFIQEGKVLHPANRRDGQGNFHLKPNGVFWIGQGTAGVSETARFAARPPKAMFATQSGPMLVIAGRIHPKIHAEGTSRKIRNGVGISSGHVAQFAISDEPVTFYEFASLFKDRLGCSDALFLDGSISSLYTPALGRNDRFRPLGPIIGVVEQHQ